MATLSSVLPPVSVSTASGILPVGNGGTGANELTLDNVLLGNGSSAPKVVAPGTAGNVLTSNGTTWASSPAAGGSITATASGSISAGAPVIVNDTGSVATPTQVVTTLNPATVSTYYSTTTGTAYYLQGINYDSVGNRVIAVFQNDFNYPCAVIGTISGDVITWGTPTVLVSSGYGIKAVQAIDSSRTMIVYDYSAVILQHPANTLSLGTSATASTTAAYGMSCPGNFSVHVASNSTVYVLLKPVTTPYTWLCTRITYSGNTISSYTEFTEAFGSTSSNFPQIATDGTRLCVHYINGSGNSVIKVGTISGSSVTWSAEQTVQTTVRSDLYASTTGVAYNPASGSWVALYYNSAYLSAMKLFTLSGSTATFGSQIANADSAAINVVAVSSPTLNFISYICGTTRTSNTIRTIHSISGLTASFTSSVVSINSGYEYSCMLPFDEPRFLYVSRAASTYNITGVVVTVATVAKTLTAERYAGISSGTYTNGQTATINTEGSVNTAVSGLTPGTVYYVNPSGGLQTTAGNPSVLAGVALSSTSLLVK